MTTDPRRAVQALRGAFLARYPEEAAGVLDPLPPAELARVLAAEPAAAAPVFERLTPQAAGAALAALEPAAGRALLGTIDPGRAAGCLAWLEEADRAAWLAQLEPHVAREIGSLLAYPPDSAGGLMDPRATVLREDATVRDALARLRAGGGGRTRVHDVFVADDAGRLVGAVTIQDLALAAPGDRLSGLIHGTVPRVSATASRSEVVEQLEHGPLTSLAVVDFEGRILGVIRHAALVAVAQEAATADLQTMVGASPDERALSSARFAVRKRLPWLQINLGTAFLAAAVVGLFEDTIARFTALAVLLPVVAGQSGNTGSQALAVTMRGLALREIRVRHWLRVARKELAVGAINGVAVATVTALGVYVWSRSLGLCLVIATAMVLSMVIAGLSGATIPVVLSRLGQDPAQSSSIILTTVTDVVGFLSFLGLATLGAGIL